MAFLLTLAIGLSAPELHICLARHGHREWLHRIYRDDSSASTRLFTGDSAQHRFAGISRMHSIFLQTVRRLPHHAAARARPRRGNATPLLVCSFESYGHELVGKLRFGRAPDTLSKRWRSEAAHHGTINVGLLADDMVAT